MKINYMVYAVITALLFIIGVFTGMQLWASDSMPQVMPTAQDSAFEQHCKTMPAMAGCEKFAAVDMMQMDHSNMDPMQMSMADMWAMLEGASWDELDRAFLEGMIPHHQWAIDMAKYLVNAKHPELKAMWEEIITAQQAEIDQMNDWLVEWGYKQ